MRKWIPSFLKPILIKIFSYFEKLSVKKFDGVILAEDSYKKKFIQSKKIITVRNYVKLLSKSIQRDSSNRNILYVGSITIQRGILDLIKSLKLLQRNNNNIGLFLIGNISEIDKSIIYDHINLLPHPKNVKIINFCDHDELKEYVKQSRVGVSPLRDNDCLLYTSPSPRD